MGLDFNNDDDDDLFLDGIICNLSNSIFMLKSPKHHGINKEEEQTNGSNLEQGTLFGLLGSQGLDVDER